MIINTIAVVKITVIIVIIDLVHIQREHFQYVFIRSDAFRLH